jgi:hypothetical protein
MQCEGVIDLNVVRIMRIADITKGELIITVPCTIAGGEGQLGNRPGAC